MPGFDDPLYLDGVGAFLAGPANVVMQLALAPVGYGVLESKVDSGKVTLHPLKRFRTTFTYLAVAMLGTDADRDRYRAAVNSAHRLVHSDEASPVPYNAFDPALQLWVAACLYYGSVYPYEWLHGPMPDDLADAFYTHAGAVRHDAAGAGGAPASPGCCAGSVRCSAGCRSRSGASRSTGCCSTCGYGTGWLGRWSRPSRRACRPSPGGTCSRTGSCPASSAR